MAFCVVTVLAGFVAPAAWIETAFCRGVYPWIQAALVAAFGWTGVPIMGACLIVLPVAIMIVATRRWGRARREGKSVTAITTSGSITALRMLLYGYTAFLLLWGMGYRREPIESRWQLGAELPTYAQVREVQGRILAIIHADCPSTDHPDQERAMQAIVDEELRLVAELEGWTPTATRPKFPPAGMLMAVGIFGIVSPFTLEANVDDALPHPFDWGLAGTNSPTCSGTAGKPMPTWSRSSPDCEPRTRSRATPPRSRC